MGKTFVMCFISMKSPLGRINSANRKGAIGILTPGPAMLFRRLFEICLTTPSLINGTNEERLAITNAFFRSRYHHVSLALDGGAPVDITLII